MTSPATPRPTELPPELLQVATEALSKSAGDRDDALRALEETNPQFQAALRLLAADLAAAERLLATHFPPGDDQPEQLGPFRVLERLGEGAFGEVFLCQQQTPVQRQVAVKVLRPGAGDRSIVERFNNERQLIASLQHQTIAQVFDAGTLADGRPYFVMDAIDGLPIGHYCDQRSLPIPARLGLFLELCHGVQHAHARGIVHRDLKPANVLVVDGDGRALPKIIDFGIAKALQGELHERTFATEAGRVVGTPGYMSPEQANGRSDEVDARADVFALGVMLYELLCGQLPWDELRLAPTTDPPRPSQRVTTQLETATAIAARRASEPRRLASELRGDLDWIVQKCLRLDRRERYASVHDLIDDVERHVGGRPVHAGPPSLTYRLRKFARRNRVWMAAATAIAATLAVGIGVSMHSMRETRASEQRRLQDALDAASRLLTRAQDPLLFAAPRRDELRRELMQDALSVYERAGVSSDVPEQRALRVRILSALADTYYVLGLVPEGLQVAEQAVACAEALVAAASDPIVHRALRALALRNVARLQLMRSEYALAEPCFARAIDELDRLRHHQPDQHANLLAKALVEYALTLFRIGDQDGQLAAQQRAIEVLTTDLRTHPDNDESQRDLVRFHCGLANIWRRRDQLDRAVATLEQAQRLAATLPRVTAEEHALVDNRLGSVHAARGDGEAAIEAYERAAQRFVPMLQRDPGSHQLRLNLVTIHQSLARLYHELGDAGLALDRATAAVADVQGLVAQVSGRTTVLDVLLSMSELVAADCSPRSVEAAHVWLQQAAELAALLPDSEPRAASLRLCAAMQFAVVRSCLSKPLAPGTWQHNLELARVVADREAEFDCLQRLASDCLEDHDLDGARTMIAAAQKVLPVLPDEADLGTCRAVLGRIAWRVEYQAGDAKALVEIVHGLLDGEPDWQALHHAADGWRAAATLSEAAANPDAASYEARSLETYERLARLHDDGVTDDRPTRRLALAQARLRLAAAMPATSDEAAQLRNQALTTLATLRPLTLGSWWDQELWLHATTHGVHFELQQGRFAAALAHVERLTDEPCVVDELLCAVDLFAACTRAAGAASRSDHETVRWAQQRTVATLANAIAHGADRDRIAKLMELPLLQSLPDALELFAKLRQ